MVLANRTKIQSGRSLVRVFGGLNETYACTEAEYSEGVNFSARDFPALSTRKPRRKLRALAGLNGMYHLNGLLTVCGKDLVYTPDDRSADAVTCENAVSDSKKALVGIGTKILIFPDKLAFDTADGSVSPLGALWQAQGQSVQFTPCDASGKTYKADSCGREEPKEPKDGQLFLKVEEEDRPWSQYRNTGSVQRKLGQLDGCAAGILPDHSCRCGKAVCSVGHGDSAGHCREAGRHVGRTGWGSGGV